MSDSNTQIPGTSATEAAPAHPAAQNPQETSAPAPVAVSPAVKPRKMSTFLKVSIILLAGLTIASISLVFIGEFEGKFERVFSTFALFAVFVLFTALDTRREQKSDWYAPVALIANAYILSLLLIVIWMTRFNYFSLMWEIFWKSVFVIVVTRLVILCCQWLLGMGAKTSEVVSRFAFITSVLGVLSGILFTAPVGIEAFDLFVPDLYWKIATALLILTALGLSITLLLRWSLGSEERAAAREAHQRQWAASQAAHAAAVAAQPVPVQQIPDPYASVPQTPIQPLPAPTQQLLPWPTFADGRPLPAGPDGQPDFSVLQ
ncbi:hypothetical protein G7067_00635 [Leucobacter insecticola]|uniref:Uncharacterized protein n=1 Tax=Leucobacter insecticola TaxID=2714934 RepID=A0A6G8FFU6_9MICO|nr:hypothetical protein [Leucobacter insecticola]QIM15261.1 hypothetical protein G7067_00635 [Leucobacter insecticola]